MLRDVRYLLFSLIILNHSMIYSQGNQGMVILNNGVEHHGLVLFDPGDRVVRVEFTGETEVIKAFSPHQVKYFSYYDPQLEARRVFAPIDFSLHPNATSREFFEVLLSGTVSVLRMEEKRLINYTHPLSPEITMTKVVTDYQHYLFIDGALYEYENFKKQALPLLSKFQADLTAFIKDNRLKLNDFISQIRVVDLYNQLDGEGYVAVRE